MTMFLNYLYSNLSFTDISKIIKAMYNLDKESKQTMKEWLEAKDFTEEGKKAIRKLCLSFATNEGEMLKYIFFKTLREGQTSNLIQSKDNDLWISKWERDLSSRENVKIIKNSKLIHLKHKDNKIIEAKVSSGVCTPDVYICAFPLYPLKELVNKCSKEIQSNWMEPEAFNQYCYESSYSGLGFQLHFTEAQKYINMWKTKNFSDWGIEILSINSYSNEPTKNRFIKEVWSCVIVDTNSTSAYLGKSVNEIDDINDVINESIRQLSLMFNASVTPYKVTLSKGVHYNKEKKYWDMEHSAYNAFKQGPLSPKGKIDNLYSVGPHNLYELAVLETAFKSADFFLKDFSE